MSSWHPRAPREHPVVGLPSRAGQCFFRESRGLFLLKTRLSGGLELFANSGQMQQGVLVETKGGRFERECQNIFSLFFPPVTKYFFFFRNRPNFLETLKQNTDKQTHLHRTEWKMGANCKPPFPVFVFTWGAQGAQGEGAALIKREKSSFLAHPNHSPQPDTDLTTLLVSQLLSWSR